MNRDPSGPFIGYGRLEDLLAAHEDREEPFYVEFLVRRFPGHPIGWAEQTVVVQDFDPKGRVRYCRISLGGYDLLHGQPFDEERARSARDRAKERHAAVLERLASLGCRIERATIATPKDLVLLDVDADFLHDEKGV